MKHHHNHYFMHNHFMHHHIATQQSDVAAAAVQQQASGDIWWFGFAAFIIIIIAIIVFARFLFNFESLTNNHNQEVAQIRPDVTPKYYPKYRKKKFAIDPEEQLGKIQSNALKKRPIMNNKEKDVYEAAKSIINQGEMVFTQITMGAIISSDSSYSSDVYSAYGSKRIDILICKNDRMPLLAIEYNGSGHFGNDKSKTEMRDKVKAAALEKARIPLLIIEDSDSNKNKDDFRQEILFMLESIGWKSKHNWKN
jgi:Protein of unknown function (DUF2726)